MTIQEKPTIWDDMREFVGNYTLLVVAVVFVAVGIAVLCS